MSFPDITDKAEGGHTPHEWRWEREGCKVRGPRYIVAQVGIGGATESELERRGRLIAAAPDLLSELQRMVDHFGAWASDHAADATAETWAALHCARAAIQRATGGDQ